MSKIDYNINAKSSGSDCSIPYSNSILLETVQRRILLKKPNVGKWVVVRKVL